MLTKFLTYLSYFYFFLSKTERLFYKIFNFLVNNPKAYVISIGNISMGGTGKTPVLFELLKETNTSSCVLTRGYRCPWEKSFYLLHGNKKYPFELTDETLMTNKRFPEIPILVGKNRHHSSIIAEDKFKPQIIFLDDGFQYRRIRKDYNILLWDSMCKPEEAFTVPKGVLREPFERLASANAILLTRCETANKEQIDYWINRIKSVAPNVPIIKIKTVCDGLYDYNGNKIKQNSKNYFAFSGIGRPESFYSQLSQLQCKVSKTKQFRDHHRFTYNELNELDQISKEYNLQLVCTEKDFIKIPYDIADKMNLQILRIRAIPENEKSFVKNLGLEKYLLS